MIRNLMDNGIDVKKIFKYGLLLFLSFGLFGFAIFYFISVDKYVIVDESLILTKSHGKWIKVDDFKSDIMDYTYTVIGNFETKNNVYLKYGSGGYRWSYFDKNYKDLNLNGVRIAYTDKFEGIKVAESDFSYYDESDDEFLENVLDNNNIDDFKNSVMKNSYDLDGDGKVEVIYTLTNDSLQGNVNSKFSSIFAVSGNSFVGLLDDDSKLPYIVREIVDLDSDGKYEVVVSKGTLDLASFDTCYQIYEFKDSKFNRIMDCK